MNSPHPLPFEPDSGAGPGSRESTEPPSPPPVEKIDFTHGFTEKLRVGPSPGRGRGVFAAIDFCDGDLIERAPVIVIPGVEEELLERTALYNYIFAWPPEPQGSAIALGYGSIYNHARRANARYIKRPETGVIDFVATRDIGIGEEITINYNGDGDPEEPVWFELRD